MTEVWQDIPGFAGYQASSEGRIRSLTRRVPHGRGQGRWRILQGQIIVPYDNGRYLTVRLSRETLLVHRLVLAAFKGLAPTDKHECRHLNGDSRDNRPQNLEWGLRTENQFDRFAHGTACEGEKNYRARLTTEEVHSIVSLKSEFGPNIIARKIGVDKHLVKSVIYGCAWNWLTGIPRRRYRRKKVHGSQ